MPLDQILQLAQTLRLSPTLLQSMGILQMTTLELAQYLHETALENPVLVGGEPDTASWEEFVSQVPWLQDSILPAGQGTAYESAAAPEPDALPLILREQLERRRLDQRLLALCQYLVDLLGPRGDLDREDLENVVEIGVPRALVDEAVEVIQSLDPAGVGARDVSECLKLQLARLPERNPLAEALCDHLDRLATGELHLLAKQFSVSDAELKEAADLVRSLDPDPVAGLTTAAPTVYIRPDAWVAEVDGELRVYVNQWDLPQFHLSSAYLEMVKGGIDQETAAYLQQKIRQARWVLQCVQRRGSTLHDCLTHLVRAQEDFFRGKAPAPGPLLRRELAQAMEVHPSTVTRALAHKYIQCRQGLFPTSDFFSRPTGGQVASSPKAIQACIAQAVRGEDGKRPLSDQALTDLLAKDGIQIARRTVAKYRRELGIPDSYRRKK